MSTISFLNICRYNQIELYEHSPAADAHLQFKVHDNKINIAFNVVKSVGAINHQQATKADKIPWKTSTGIRGQYDPILVNPECNAVDNS